MTSFPGSPRVLKASIVVMDPDTASIERTVAFQYNPEKLTRALQPKYSTGESGQALDPYDFNGTPTETITLVAEIDATDEMEKGNGKQSDGGIMAQLEALETLVYPGLDMLRQEDRALAIGTMRIEPLKGPLCLLVWNENRMAPVKVTSISVEEQAFDPYLNPIQASVTISMEILSLNDLKMSSKAGQLYVLYQQGKERRGKGVSASGANVTGVRP